MYDVLIVDDERYVRLWVKNCIKWEDYGFRIVGEAENGNEALEKIEAMTPRLVISDMDMPELDGIGLIEKANEMNPDLIFLILSGYNEYKYLQSAVKNNAVDYMLKPVDTEDLIPVVQKIRIRLQEQDKKKQERLLTSKAIKENLELRREKFFMSLLDEEVLTLQELKEKELMLDLQKMGDAYSIISINFDEDAYSVEPSNKMNMQLLRFSITNVAQELFAENKIASYYVSRKNEVVGIINFDKQADALKRVTNVCREIIQNLNKFFNINTYIGVGSEVKDIMYIGASYAEAKKALDLVLIYGNNSVLTFLDAPPAFDREVYSTADENNLINAIASLNHKACNDLIMDIFVRLQKTDEVSIETIKMVYYNLVSTVLKAIYKAGITPSYLRTEEIDLFNAIKHLSSIEQIRDNLLIFTNNAIDGISNTQSIKNSAVETAQRYIMENFRSDITLSQISNYVYLTPSYFSGLFKAETGYNISDYITKLRIDEVKSLMADKNLKTYEIGEMVGYKEPKYFCRVFKKIIGQSPLQYRKRIFGDL